MIGNEIFCRRKSFSEKILTPDFWNGAISNLSASSKIDCFELDLSDDQSDAVRGDIHLDGATIAESVVPSKLSLELREGIDEVRRVFGHEIFALVYDQPWEALGHSLPYIRAAMGSGCRAVPMPFVNYVPPGDAGFAPHRDRKFAPIADDGMPNIMTVWTAVTEASTKRGCLAVLPTRFDPCFPDQLDQIKVSDARNIRALPVQAGDSVIFNQAIVHMGTRNVTDKPRVAFAIEIERAGLPGARRPGIELDSPISLQDRLALIGVSIGALSRNNLSFEDSHLDLARAMAYHAHGDEFDYLWGS